ncbi:MAG: transcriptional repressor [Chloroflexi bacterium]|nr:transcriptional repressor [Chloroflexota bacterium]
MVDIQNDAAERLHSQGGRMTAQRRLILSTLESLSGHPTAEQIYEQARLSDPRLNLSTVYRTLRWLSAEGLVSPQRFEGQQRQGRFDLGQAEAHHHFLCVSCGRVIEFSEPALEVIGAKWGRRLHVRVDGMTLVLRGLCEACRSAGVQATDGGHGEVVSTASMRVGSV